jgi:Tol biopolymer transport system component
MAAIAAGCGDTAAPLVFCPQWILEGEILLAVDAGLLMIDSDGTGLLPVTNGTYRARFPAFSRDGTQASFARADGSGDEYELYVSGPELCPQRRLTRASDMGLSAGRHAWSPDGARIAYEANGDLFVIAVEGGSATRLTQGPKADDHPTWSQDGTRIAFQRDSDIWVMDADGSDPTLLVEDARSPSWSPNPADGRRIAFVSLAAPGGLRVLEDDGSNVPFGDPLAPVGDDLAWDGEEIASVLANVLVIVDPTAWRSYEVSGDPGAEAQGLTWRR